MCDYSLMAVPSRLVKEGESLVTHRFPTGSMGLASPEDVARFQAPIPKAKGFWQKLKTIFRPVRVDQVCAVCIPPGASLMLLDIPSHVQKGLGIGTIEEVTFVQLDLEPNQYRDAVKFRNNQVLRLQELRSGQRVEVISVLPESEAVRRVPVEEPSWVNSEHQGW